MQLPSCPSTLLAIKSIFKIFVLSALRSLSYLCFGFLKNFYLNMQKELIQLELPDFDLNLNETLLLRCIWWFFQNAFHLE